MKQIVFFFFLILSVSAVAQKDSSAIRKYIFKTPKDRIAIDFNATNWLHKIPDFKSKWYGRGINVYFMYDFQIKKSPISFAPGLGVSCFNIYNNSQLTDTGGVAVFTPLTNYSNYKVNKVSLTYIDIPLELRWRSKPDKLDNRWKMAIGFKAGIRVDAHTKQVTKSPKESVKHRFYPDFNLFHCGPTFRFGYGSFNITGYYGVLNVFKTGKGPQANEFSIGISFNGL